MLTAILTQSQINHYKSEGHLVVKNAVSIGQLSKLKQEVLNWVEKSRSYNEPFGEPTIDGRPRFDMGIEHTFQNPTLRRVNNPSDISQNYFDVMSSSPIIEMVADLIGQNVKFHHCKINLKCPGSNTEVHYHQDFAFTPHSNDDVVTALLMLDDITENNGCLMVVPKSHKGPMYSLFQDQEFVGKVNENTERLLKKKQISVTGTAGSVCLMHTRLAHGSAPNMSQTSRGLYICVYSATDAIPLARNPMPNPNEGRILRGEPSTIARMINFEVELPKQPKSASFFTVQGQDSLDSRPSFKHSVHKFKT